MDAAQLPGSRVVSQVVSIDLERVRACAGSVVDPEIPVLTIEDLGVLRDVAVVDGTIVVTITPTYTGCPAMTQIADDIVAALGDEGFSEAEVRIIHYPVWSTSWMSPEGRAKLEEFGVAPPTGRHEIVCPRCRSDRPTMISEYGSTACKALMVCSVCSEPFDYFKEF